MAKYMQQAAQLSEQVDGFLAQVMEHIEGQPPATTESTKQVKCDLAKELGYIISKSIQCHTRPLQTTVRKNIIQEAVGEYCNITVKEEVLPATDRYPTPKTIKKVLISPKQ